MVIGGVFACGKNAYKGGASARLICACTQDVGASAWPMCACDSTHDVGVSAQLMCVRELEADAPKQCLWEQSTPLLFLRELDDKADGSIRIAFEYGIAGVTFVVHIVCDVRGALAGV